jgi:hypothetical protein
MKWCSVLFSIICFCGFSQDLSQSKVVFEPIQIQDWMGVQSFASGVVGDEVLIIGGRLDGLHKRQPWASFDSAGHNNQLMVLNLKTRQIWKTSLNVLPDTLADQLKATNHCVYQENEQLLLVGGYGISTRHNDHVTFSAAIRLSIPTVINAVKNNQLLVSNFEQANHAFFAVTGGQLTKFNNHYYLVGGQLFDGRYNPRNGPTFVQVYTNAIRVFDWEKEVNWLPGIDNEELLHKRDYNLQKVIDASGKEVLVAFSGVFQQDVDLPFQEATIITEDSIYELRHFRQFFNQYECADISFYNPEKKQTDVLFFGGIAQFYDSLGVIYQDDNVPFTKNIARVHFEENAPTEWLLNEEMPALIGAGTAFVPSNSSNWKNGIYWCDGSVDTVDLGYLVGGIISTSRNVFWINEGNESAAIPTIYRVKLVPNTTPHRLNNYGVSTLNVNFYRQSLSDPYYLTFSLKKPSKMKLTVLDYTGKTVVSKQKKYKTGTWRIDRAVPKTPGKYRIILDCQQNPFLRWEQGLVVE